MLGLSLGNFFASVSEVEGLTQSHKVSARKVDDAVFVAMETLRNSIQDTLREHMFGEGVLHNGMANAADADMNRLAATVAKASSEVSLAYDIPGPVRAVLQTCVDGDAAEAQQAKRQRT